MSVIMLSSDDNGFTLIEVLIAMVVLSIGIFALFSMQANSVLGNANASAISEARNASREKIEELLGIDFDETAFDAGDHTEAGVFPINNISLSVTDWDNDDVDNDGDGKTDEFDERGVKSILLTVQYTDMGRVKNTSIQFLKTEIL